MTQTRRDFLIATTLSAGSVLSPAGVLALDAEPTQLSWKDLAPGAETTVVQRLRNGGIVQHGELSEPVDAEKGAQLTTKYNGLRVRLPGYLVPLKFEENKVLSALLVPYVGACIHVPPPPPNQLVLLTLETPYELEALFEPVWAIGVFSLNKAETQLAKVGYAITTEEIQSFN
ncbi:hypothetical protein RUESEDTHA_03661 [Ruegeria sp. THAF57]|uniref:DUF3299 domain-containing protein n=1 Tax=Ruegeria sp. THAF57 TaxID=2744555 RepID=UPI0015DF30B0|nr:DUF3299 domain-containing protein [Ruegeria sp. THAF57]CAD0186750.1 hypothetical protein RUESEDTHA_03661 [Ruegeria sp. THAF57]